MLEREQCAAGMAIVYRAASGDATSAFLEETVHSWIRFAGGRVVQTGQRESIGMTVRVCVGKRSAMATTNELTGSGLRQVGIKASEMAKAAAADPAHAPVLTAQEYAQVPAFDAALAALSFQDAMASVDEALAVASRASVTGSLEWRARTCSVGSSLGNFGYHRRTEAMFAIETDASSHGWAACTSTRLADLDLPALARQCLARAALPQSRGKEPVVAVEPFAAAAVLRVARRCGCVPRQIELRSDPAHVLLLAAPFAPDGSASEDAIVFPALGLARENLLHDANGLLVSRIARVEVVRERPCEMLCVAQGVWVLEAGVPVRAVHDCLWRVPVANLLQRIAASGVAERVQATLDDVPMAMPGLRFEPRERSP